MKGKSFVIDDLARIVSKNNGGTIKDRKAQIIDVFAAIRYMMLENMDVGDRIMIDYFGIFKCKLRSGRVVNNPQVPGETIDVKPHLTITFKPSSLLRADLND